ncbi:MAG: hypothetical protein UV74_C0001G0109 [Candidatus Woesebacteria bacterium GW2011_GWB1_43_14]|uniref:Putative membrane protein insertion efficiency factor n=1 Tax=Candidatus Woesebacteria bacterium GW2011_GWB1_43_14 TaxID=1618578 RepID=A0A0G1DMW4_9BACT|nr:MAG: hypothetical protein UT21_C0007G0015 [Candidatus Woesebacteria bacterium GW2011_GWA1_39_11b]KKS78262.1 MAG: hypothetical protein UV51_C0002G0098 [Candidatus Woesebacteria bacterium GW2011_GWC1_42_9]KKS98999.1 MAG: hypothetical protein UV74_C0001G0109 [Candidatus Woesebacteria bacterium GW2011_GWB1_43_14]
MIDFYQKFISSVLSILFGKGCRHLPTCSEYAKEAVAKYGVVKGAYLTAKRVIKCNPLVRSSYDPVR